MGLVKTSFLSLKINTLCSPKSRPEQTHRHLMCSQPGSPGCPPRGAKLSGRCHEWVPEGFSPFKVLLLKYLEMHLHEEARHPPAPPGPERVIKRPTPRPAGVPQVTRASRVLTSCPWPRGPDLSQRCVSLVLHGSRLFPPTAVSLGLGAAETWLCRGPLCHLRSSLGLIGRGGLGPESPMGPPPPGHAVSGPLSADLQKTVWAEGSSPRLLGGCLGPHAARPLQRVLRPTEQGPRNGPEITEPPIRAQLTLGKGGPRPSGTARLPGRQSV